MRIKQVTRKTSLPQKKATPATEKSYGSNKRSIFGKIGGKFGRFRGNLSGKRINFCGRAVISPDNFLSIDEIGVGLLYSKIQIPEKIALDLTFPERVTILNLKTLQGLVSSYNFQSV